MLMRCTNRAGPLQGMGPTVSIMRAADVELVKTPTMKKVVATEETKQ